MKAEPAAVFGVALLMLGAGVAHADEPDYSGFLKAVAKAGDAPAADDRLIAMGDIVCDALRSGVPPQDEEQTVQQSIPGITVVQTEVLVHGAQDYICPNTI